MPASRRRDVIVADQNDNERHVALIVQANMTYRRKYFMSDLNIVALMGRITRDAEMKTTASGKSFVRFSIAVNRTRKQGENYISVPSFFNLFHFGKAAEGIFPYLKKGQLVAIEGHLEQRTWEQQGEKRSSTEIVIDKLNLAGWRREPEVTPIEDAIPDEISLLDELRDHPDFDLY